VTLGLHHDYSEQTCRQEMADGNQIG
jgi:hypothetical protein